MVDVTLEDCRRYLSLSYVADSPSEDTKLCAICPRALIPSDTVQCQGKNVHTFCHRFQGGTKPLRPCANNNYKHACLGQSHSFHLCCTECLATVKSREAQEVVGKKRRGAKPKATKDGYCFSCIVQQGWQLIFDASQTRLLSVHCPRHEHSLTTTSESYTPCESAVAPAAAPTMAPAEAPVSPMDAIKTTTSASATNPAATGAAASPSLASSRSQQRYTSLEAQYALKQEKIIQDHKTQTASLQHTIKNLQTQLDASVMKLKSVSRQLSYLKRDTVWLYQERQEHEKAIEIAKSDGEQRAWMRRRCSGCSSNKRQKR